MMHVDTRLEHTRPTLVSVPRSKVVHCPTLVGTVSLALAPYLSRKGQLDEGRKSPKSVCVFK